MGKYACSGIDVLWWYSELVSYFIICIIKINTPLKQFTRIIFIQEILLGMLLACYIFGSLLAIIYALAWMPKLLNNHAA